MGTAVPALVKSILSHSVLVFFSIEIDRAADRFYQNCELPVGKIQKAHSTIPAPHYLWGSFCIQWRSMAAATALHDQCMQNMFSTQQSRERAAFAELQVRRLKFTSTIATYFA
jgi:hypothetical protein